MSEDTTEVQETEETEEDGSGDVVRSQIEDLETARKEIDKLRRENAKRRVQTKEDKQLIEDAKKWQEHLDSQKSEMDRLAEANARLEEKLAQRELALTQKMLAEEAGLDPDLAEFITGVTEDEMRAKAQKLASKAVKPGPTDLFAGQRGAPVVGRPSTGAAFLDSLAKKR